MTPPSGARESNAGDDFHVLWASRRALGLLDPSSGLELVAMEELYPHEGEIEPELLLGVDLTEYFGGTDLASAERVVVSQLKYSHRHPNLKWTAARLAESKGGRASVIKRLADLYRGLSGAAERERLLEILSIRLISNQPLGPKLRSALEAAKRWLEQHPGRARSADMSAALSATNAAEIKRLRVASKLQSQDFTDFLRVFELDLGAASRYEQELEITGALGTHLSASIEHGSLALYNLVRKRATPEGVGLPIRRADVLVALGVHDEASLLPAPSAFLPPERTLVSTTNPDRILEALRASESRTVIAHGDAGVGKTTSVLQLKAKLPEGSAVIVLDCYAGGDYRKPAHSRHRPERALLQICNELAVQCRLPMLLEVPESEADLWLELERRLAAAAETLAASGAELIVVIDAIDNAAAAARERGDPSFVPDLWSLAIPEGAGLVASARTARLHLLDAPEETPQLCLSGFDTESSASLLRLEFPDASDEQCLAFHSRSQGNPRVQSYVLDVIGGDPARGLVEAIELAERTPEDIFEEVWRAAEEVVEPAWARGRLADLICLTAPVGIGHLRDAASSDGGKASEFCHALVPGLRIEGEQITIQDEDFEHFLEEKLGEEDRPRAHRRLASIFAAQADQDPYAATVLAEHLYGAGSGEELIELVIEGGEPEALADPLARLQVYLRRVGLALLCSETPQRRLEAAKLLSIAARTTATDAAIATIIRERPELALRHGDPDAVSAIWREDENLDWQGPIHMRLASITAREGRDEDAQAHLNATGAWLDQRHEAEDTWELEATDLSAAVEAIYVLRGFGAAMAQVRRWRPREFTWALVEDLAGRLGQWVEPALLLRQIFSSGLPPQVKARMLLATGIDPTQIPKAPLLRLARRLAANPTRAAHLKGDWPVEFAEVCARRLGMPRLTVRLLNALEPPRPQRAPGRYRGSEPFVGYLRARSMRAACRGRELTLEELYPESLHEEPGSSNANREEHRREHELMRRQVEPLIDIYTRRARALLSKPRVQALAPVLRERLGAFREAGPQDWREERLTYSSWLRPAAELLTLAGGSDASLVEDAVNVAETNGHHDLGALRVLAAALLVDARYRPRALGVLERAAHEAEQSEKQASVLTDLLLDLSELADPHSPELAADFYSRAVTASAGLDEEGIVTLEQNAQIASSLAGIEDGDGLAERLVASAVDYRGRVSEAGYLPWTETLEGAIRLSLPRGLALLARWEDLREMRISEGILTAAPILAEAGVIGPSEAISLLGLVEESGRRGATLTKLLDQLAARSDREQVTAELERLSGRVRRDLLREARRDAATTMLSWAEKEGLEQAAAITALAPYRDALVDPEESESTIPHRQDERAMEERELRQEAASCVPERFGELAERVRQTIYDPELTLELLLIAADASPPAQRPALLDAIAAMPADSAFFRFNAGTTITLLDTLLERWSGSAEIKRWRKERLGPLLAKQLPNLTRYRTENEERLSAVAELIGTRATAELAIEAVAAGIEQFGPDGLHALSRWVAADLEPGERAVYLDWSLSLLEETESQPPVALEAAGEPELLARLLWSLFANPDTRVRWRAAHVARELLAGSENGAALAAELLRLCEKRDGGAFSAPGLPFYWMSARTFVLMTLARLADERPELMAPHAERLAEIANSKEWPHAAQREHARQAALAIAATPDSPLSDEQVAELEHANRPSACLAKRGPHYGVGAPPQQQAERWHFGMDTDDAWFRNLGECFGANQHEVAVIAEEFLIDRLGESPEMEDRRGDPRMDGTGYGLLTNHHGSLPTIESPSLTLEYNALHLAAGKLLDKKKPILVETYEPVTDPWQEWLRNHCAEMPGVWISDLREPTPSEPALLECVLKERRWPAVPPEHFELLLGHPGGRTMVPSAYFDYRSPAGYGWDAVCSALVEPSTAASLAEALEAAENMSFFRLPKADEEGFRDDEIDAEPFRLLGWLLERERLREGPGQNDPLARISASDDIPGRGFLDHHGAEVDLEGTTKNAEGERLAWVRRFSDHPPSNPEREERNTSFSASGRQTVITNAALTSYLQAVEMSLIIKIEAVRRDRNSDSEGEKHAQEVQQAIIIDQDGGITGLPGCEALG